MISVIIPYVKDRGYLSDAIQSVTYQTFKDIELIPIQREKTQGANINRGLQIAKGEYIKILHDDDILPEDSLEILHIAIQGYDFACADQETFGEPLFCPTPEVYKGCNPTFEGMCKGNQIYGGTTIYRKDTLESVGGYDEFLWTGEEYDLHLKLLYSGYTCNYIPKVVHLYRLHEFNKSYYMGPGEKKERREFIQWIAEKYRLLSRTTKTGGF